MSCLTLFFSLLYNNGNSFTSLILIVEQQSEPSNLIQPIVVQQWVLSYFNTTYCHTTMNNLRFNTTYCHTTMSNLRLNISYCCITMNNLRLNISYCCTTMSILKVKITLCRTTTSIITLHLFSLSCNIDIT